MRKNDIRIETDFDHIKDNTNSSTYFKFYDLSLHQKDTIEKLCAKTGAPFKVLVNGKYVGKYGKCGAWHYVFNHNGVRGQVLIHTWAGTKELLDIKELNKRWGVQP